MHDRSALIINTQARSNLYKTLRSAITEVLELESTVALAHEVVDAVSGHFPHRKSSDVFVLSSTKRYTVACTVCSGSIHSNRTSNRTDLIRTELRTVRT